MNNLTVRGIAALSPGLHADGNGLYLKVTAAGTKSWVFRYAVEPKVSAATGKKYRSQIKMGLGKYPAIGLADARELATTHAKVLAAGKDPKTTRDARKQADKLKQVWTFDKCADAYITAHEASWKNKKHGKQWRSTLAQYASPVFGDLPVEDVSLALVLDVLEPIWQTKTETASRVRGRIESVLSWAIVKGYRPAPNPAVWRGNLIAILPKPTKVTKPYTITPCRMLSCRCSWTPCAVATR